MATEAVTVFSSRLVFRPPAGSGGFDSGMGVDLGVAETSFYNTLIYQ